MAHGPFPQAFATSASDPPGTLRRRLGAYVHVPFCQRRCGYCAFHTVAVGDGLSDEEAAAFTDLVIAEMRLAAIPARGYPGRPTETLYFGGGTPTMLPAEQIGRIVEAARHHLGLAEDAEVTIEANPDGLAEGQLASLRALGVTRISFGLQSVRTRVLELLDRTHDPLLALDAVEAAKAAGFDHIGLDLIHGTPGETPEDWMATLDAAIASGVDHVSAYSLAVEPGTKLAARVRSGELPTPLDDEAAERYAVAEERLAAAGFEWYELSNWSRTPDGRSRHNLLYWRNEDWVGLGPSAHSHLDGVRWHNPDRLAPWSEAVRRGRPERVDTEQLDEHQRELERVMLGVRLAEGLDVSGLPADAVGRLVDEGFAQLEDGRLRLTLRGRLLADVVVMALTP